MPVVSSTSLQNGETITCPSCHEGFNFEKDLAKFVKNEKNEEINLDQDIYYQNLSFINEIKGNTINYDIMVLVE